MSTNPIPTPPLVISVTQVIEQMYRMARVLPRAGVGLNGSQQTEGLHVLNALLDGVKIEPFFFYRIIRTLVPTQIGKKDYTVGDASLGADWQIERPEKILSAGVIIPNNPAGTESEVGVSVLLDYHEYQDVITKLSPSALPLLVYYQAEVPLGIATLWPVPNQVYSFVLYTPQTVQEFTDINSDFVVPKGYREFLEYAGAVAIHDRYPEFPLDMNVRQKAVEYKARVKAAQLTPPFMKSDPAVLKPGIAYPSWPFNGRTLIP